MRKWLHGRALSWLLIASSAACGGRSIAGSAEAFEGERCVPGQQIACACGSGLQATQVCTGQGIYGSCSCADDDRSGSSPSASAGRSGSVNPRTGAAGNGAGGAGHSGGSSGLSGGSASAGAATTGSGQIISVGTDALVDAFIGEAGIYVVLGNSITLSDRSGNVLQRVDAPREISAAAFDGEHLAIADQAKLTSYDLQLTQISSMNTLETCASLVILSQQRAVCGPANDWDRVFYTYDLASGALLGSSRKYTYNGIPMRRVPGTDDFVTVTVDSSPSDFHLYRLLDSGEASYINESPYHGDFRVTDIYGFDGSPATHLITDAGLMLRIYGDGCGEMASSFSTGCFAKDGSIGTLSGDQLFLGLDTDAQSQVYAVVDANPDPFGDPDEQPSNYLLERIDLDSRTVTKQSTISLQLSQMIAFRRDVTGGGVLVAFRKGSRSFSFPGDPYPGHEVRSIPF